MINSIIRLITIAVILTVINPSKTFASHAAAGEVTYQHISGNTYRVFYKGFFDCMGIAQPNNVSLCVTNTCNSTSSQYSLTTWTGSIPPGNRPNCSQIPVTCAGIATQCDSPASPLKGFKECWYSGFVTLNGTCSNWEFVVALNSRSAVHNLSGDDQYLRTTFNNQLSVNNSSPVFTNKPVVYTCSNMSVDYNIGMSDPDNDSLILEVIHPLSANTGGMTSVPCPITPYNVSLATTFTPAISIPGNPIPCNNTFSVNGQTGIATFTSTAISWGLLTFRVKEYRSGSLIGTTLRDVLVVTRPCAIGLPFLQVDANSFTGCTTDNGKVLGCAGRPMSFCFDVVQQMFKQNTRLYIHDSSSYVMTGATINYSSQGGDSVRGCFSWSPTLTDTGTYTFDIKITDSNCNFQGITPLVYTRTMDVKILPKQEVAISANPGNNIWPGLNVDFHTNTPACENPTYQWQVNGANVTGATNANWSTTQLKDQDKITCIYSCGDTTFCNDTSNITSNTIIMNVAVSIANVKGQLTMLLYPNPNNGHFTISLKDAIMDNALIEVINTVGQVVYREQLATLYQHQLNIEQLTSGLYTLRVISDTKVGSARFNIR